MGLEALRTPDRCSPICETLEIDRTSFDIAVRDHDYAQAEAIQKEVDEKTGRCLGCTDHGCGLVHGNIKPAALRVQILEVN